MCLCVCECVCVCQDHFLSLTVSVDGRIGARLLLSESKLCLVYFRETLCIQSLDICIKVFECDCIFCASVCELSFVRIIVNIKPI